MAPGPEKELDRVHPIRQRGTMCVAQPPHVRVLMMASVQALVQSEKTPVLRGDSRHEESKHVFAGKVDRLGGPGFALLDTAHLFSEEDGLDDRILVVEILVERADAHACPIRNSIRIERFGAFALEEELRRIEERLDQAFRSLLARFFLDRRREGVIRHHGCDRSAPSQRARGARSQCSHSTLECGTTLEALDSDLHRVEQMR